MTNEELLQQAKDQVSQKYKVWGLMRTYENYREVANRAPVSQIVQISREAALLAIQSAREEGRKEERKKFGSIHKLDCTRCNKKGVSFCTIHECPVMETLNSITSS